MTPPPPPVPLSARWPRTLAGITAYLACNRLASGTSIYSGSSADDRRAWRRCDRGGFWAEEDYSRCQYQKDVTRVLYIINQVSAAGPPPERRPEEVPAGARWALEPASLVLKVQSIGWDCFSCITAYFCELIIIIFLIMHSHWL